MGVGARSPGEQGEAVAVGSQGGCGMEASAAGEEEAEEAATVVPVGPTSPCKEEGSMLILHKYTTLGKNSEIWFSILSAKKPSEKFKKGFDANLPRPRGLQL